MRFLVYAVETTSDIQALRKFIRIQYIEDSHPRGLPFDLGIESVWRLVMCYKKRELANLNYQTKKLNLCV